MSTFEFNLKGKFSYTRREIEIEECNFKSDLSEGEVEKLSETGVQMMQCIHESNRYSDRKDYTINKIENIANDVKYEKEQMEKINKDMLSSIKNAVGEFKFESAEAKKALTTILKNVVDASSMSEKEKEKISNEIFNIANGYARSSAKINNIFSKYEK